MMHNENKNKITIIDRIRYEIDTFIQKGVSNLIFFLFVITIAITLFFAIVMCIFKIGGQSFENFREVLFYSASTIINRWMPESTLPTGSYILMSIAAITGIFITGALISIITASLDAHIDSIRHCDSLVIETNHIIILGFIDKNYVLIEELINANRDKKICIVVADNLSTEEMSKKIYQNVKVPSNVKIIFRSIDMFDSKNFDKLKICDASKVIVNLNSNVNIVKIFLAIISYQDRVKKEIPVYAIM